MKSGIESMSSFLSVATASTEASWSSDETVHPNASDNISLLSGDDQGVMPSPKESFVEKYFLPKLSSGTLPLQSEAASWLKYLIVLVAFRVSMVLVSAEFSARVLIKLNAPSYVDYYATMMLHDPLLIFINVAAVLVSLGRSMILDIFTFVMLLHGKRRRTLPKDKRLVHAVIVTQYKEPLEVLNATVSSLAESTLAHSTIVVLACEDRDPDANKMFEVLEERYSHYFRDFIKSSHKLAPGEIAGCSSNENHAARHVYEYAIGEGLDPSRVMLTICDADSLFDKCYLEHVEAEFWRTPGGERAIYDAPINTYRNLKECNLFVQACEISRCQDCLFSGMEFRPAQSNYSLCLGLAKDINFWDPSNTSEDFHCTLKAMAHTGQGKNVVVRIWSLILNDSVSSFKDRWTQAKRHMWGIEECAWTFEVMRHVRFIRWVEILGLTVQRMLFGPNSVPTVIVFLCPAVRQFVSLIDPASVKTIVLWTFFFVGGKWIRVVLREYFIRRYILADRKHMMPAGWMNWLMLLTVYPIVEQVSIIIFFSCATWAMLWRAMRHQSIVYVVAPKALNNEGNASVSGGNSKGIKKAS